MVKYDFLQIGSHTGCADNDYVRKYAKNGMTGILVEPVPSSFAKLQNTYVHINDVKFVSEAVSDTPGFAMMYVPSEDNDFEKMPSWVRELASMNRSHLEQHANHENGLSNPDLHGLKIDEIAVTTTTINTIVRDYNITELTLLQIDTEGSDYTILMSMDFNLLSPEYIMFEFKHTDGVGQFTKNYDTLVLHLSKNGYTLVSRADGDICFKKDRWTPIVNQTYKWAHDSVNVNGSITFGERLFTTWGEGSYRFLSEHVVEATWDNHTVILVFSPMYDTFTSVRMEDANISIGTHHLEWLRSVVVPHRNVFK